MLLKYVSRSIDSIHVLNGPFVGIQRRIDEFTMPPEHKFVGVDFLFQVA